MSSRALTDVAALIGDRTRIKMLAALMGGQALTAGELGRCAGVASSTASHHLGRLLDGGLVAIEAQGRHRYYRLAGRQVAETLELIAGLSTAGTDAFAVKAPAGLRFARSCYDHLAGTLAVRLTDQLIARGDIIDSGDGYHLSSTGEDTMLMLGIEIDALRERRRPMLRPCLDWTERRHHLAGSIPAAFLEAGLQRRWFARHPDHRGLRLTSKGTKALAHTFGLTDLS